MSELFNICNETAKVKLPVRMVAAAVLKVVMQVFLVESNVIKFMLRTFINLKHLAIKIL